MLLFAVLIVLLVDYPERHKCFAMFGTGFVSINCGESLGIFVNSILLIWEWQQMF